MPKNAHHATKRIGRGPKKSQVKKLVETIKKSEGMVLVDVSKVKVGDLTKLRADIRKKGGGLIVAKNRLIKRALADTQNPVPEALLKKPTAIAFGFQDPATPAKIFLAFKKDHEEVGIKGAILEKTLLDAAGVKQMADMPSRTVLLGRIAGSLNSPAQKLVFALNQTAGKIVYALDAYRRKLEEAAPAAS